MHSVLGYRKQWQKQYIAIGKTDLFYNSMGLCGNFTTLTNLEESSICSTDLEYDQWCKTTLCQKLSALRYNN